MLKTKLLAGMLAFGTVLAVAPATSQEVQIGRDGIRLVEPERVERRDRGERRDRRPVDISERQAVRIARREGLREVDDVRRMRSMYRVDGFDRRGDDIRVDIDRISGEVLSVR